MRFTISTLAASLAAYLADAFPGTAFYEDPNQQGTKCPCLFLQSRYATIAPAMHGRLYRVIGLDLTYLEDYNLPDLQTRYQAAAETLDYMMDAFSYTDGTDTTVLRTYDKEWRIDLDALHYKFELRVFVEPEDDAVLMETLTTEIEVIENGQ